MKQFSSKTHRFYLDFGPELGKFEPTVSHEVMLEKLYKLFPDYDSFDYEEKRSAWKETRNKVYQELKREYERKYSSAPRFSRIDTWQNPLYAKENSHV